MRHAQRYMILFLFTVLLLPLPQFSPLFSFSPSFSPASFQPSFFSSPCSAAEALRSRGENESEKEKTGAGARNEFNVRNTYSTRNVHNADRKNESPPCVWFVHGMIFGRSDFRQELEILRKIYPRATQVVLKRWNAPEEGIQTLKGRWNESLAESEAYAQTLAEEILSLPEPERQRLVLAGHSLGGRIIIRAMALCFQEREDIQIQQILLAGAAADLDDTDLSLAVQTSRLTVYNLVNEHDAMLAAYKIAEKHTALGTGCLYTADPERFYEIALGGTLEHFGFRYFERLLECIRSDDFRNEKIIVPQDETQVDVPVLNPDPLWKTLDVQYGWLLQEQIVTHSCRILTPENVRAASGRREILTAAFSRVAQQMQHTAGFPVPQDEIHITQTRPVVNFDALGSSGWWQTLEEFQGWKVQKNRTMPFYRLTDPANRRRAYGSRTEIIKASRQVKSQL